MRVERTSILVSRTRQIDRAVGKHDNIPAGNQTAIKTGGQTKNQKIGKKEWAQKDTRGRRKEGIEWEERQRDKYNLNYLFQKQQLRNSMQNLWLATMQVQCCLFHYVITALTMSSATVCSRSFPTRGHMCSLFQKSVYTPPPPGTWPKCYSQVWWESVDERRKSVSRDMYQYR